MELSSSTAAQLVDEDATSRLRNRYVTEAVIKEEGCDDSNVNGSSSCDTESYGIVACWKSRGQRVASSFAVANAIERKRVEGLVVDKERRDTKLERVVDVILAFPFPSKRPRCCGHGRTARGSYAAVQLLFVLGFFWFLIFPSVSPLLCREGSPLIYQCTFVQDRLRAANLTYTSDVDAQIIAMGWQDVKFSPDEYMSWQFFGTGYVYSYTKMNGLANHSNFWRNTLSEEERENYRVAFLKYRARTVISRVGTVIFVVIIVLAQWPPLLKMLHVGKHGKSNNVFYPAVLVRQENGRMQFVRRRRYVMEVALLFVLPFSLVCAHVLMGRVVFFPMFMNGIILFAFGILVGFSIQKDNVTALSTSLSECTTSEDFVIWKNKLYKPAIALLHSWSRDLSTFMVALFVTAAFFSAHICHGIALSFIQLEQQEGVLSEVVRSRVREATIDGGFSFLFMAVFLLVLLVGMSSTSMQYGGLKLVFASLELPDLKTPFYVDDFEFLLDSRGAFTVHGFPITLSGAWQLYQFTFISSVSSMIALAYLSPYY